MKDYSLYFGNENTLTSKLCKNCGQRFKAKQCRVTCVENNKAGTLLVDYRCKQCGGLVSSYTCLLLKGKNNGKDE